MKVEIGYTLRIYSMKCEPQYSGKVGTVEHIDDAGQIHGTWGGCALIPGEDKFEIVMNENKTATDKRIDTEKLTKILRNVDDCQCNGIAIIVAVNAPNTRAQNGLSIWGSATLKRLRQISLNNYTTSSTARQCALGANLNATLAFICQTLKT